MSAAPKFIVFGIDAASFSVLDYMRAEHQLKALGWMMDEGIRATLKSTIPPMSPSAWNSIFTGLDVISHGILDFLKIKPDHTLDIERSYYQPWNLWEIMESAGMRGLLFNVPFTRELMDRGYKNTVVFMGAPKPLSQCARVCSDPEIEKNLKMRFPNHYANHPGFSRTAFMNDTEGRYFRDYMEIEKDSLMHRKELISFLLKEYAFDYAIIAFTDVDTVQHYGWRFFKGAAAIQEEFDPVTQSYAGVDDVVTAVVEMFGEACRYYVVSDHGAQDVDKNFALNAYLREKGYLELSFAYQYFRTIHRAMRIWSVPWLSMKRKVLLSFFTLMPGSNTVNKLLVKTGRAPLEIPASADLDALAWDKTKAFSFGMSGGIYINDKIDFLKGAVPESEKEDLINKIKDVLESAEAQGTSLVSRVFRPSFRKTLMEKDRILPELLMIAAPGVGIVNDPGEKQILTTFKGGANHHPDGVFMTAGKDIKKGTLPPFNVYDFLPTLLKCEGVDADVEFDGCPAVDERYFKLPEKTIRVKVSPLTRENDEDAFSDEEREKVMKRLRDLGYID